MNPVTASPPNSVDPALTPGGSSSGAATSVAFGLAAAGIGSDTGGSVRVPSAWNDLVGLKTTHGLIPNTGVVPLCARFDTVGPLCRTVEDANLVTAMLTGGRAADLHGASLKGVRLLVLETVALDDGCRDEPRAAFETATARLADAGAIVTRGAIPAANAATMPFAGALFTGEAWAEWGTLIEADGDLMHPPIRARFSAGKAVSAADFARGWATLDAMRRDYVAATAGYDAVLVPTAPLLPPDQNRLLADEAFFTAENLLTLRNTRIGNLMGLCGLTLPTATPMCGIQFMGRPFDEARILRIGAAAERVVTEA